MRIQCQNCKARYKIDDSKLPKRGVTLKCPKCGSRIQIKTPPPLSSKTVDQKEACPKCGHNRLPQKAECPNCGIIYEKVEKARRKAVARLHEQAKEKRNSIEEKDPPKQNNIANKKLKEIRYTCNSCGHIWHKLPWSESKATKKATGILTGLSCLTAPCCFPLYAGLFASTMEDKQCSKCKSQNIKRKELTYDNEGNPKE